MCVLEHHIIAYPFLCLFVSVIPGSLNCATAHTHDIDMHLLPGLVIEKFILEVDHGNFMLILVTFRSISFNCIVYIHTFQTSIL